jgi:hypothetical protein
MVPQLFQLSDGERELLLLHHDFYLSLASGGDYSWRQIDEFGEGIPRPGWFSDAGWRQMRASYRFDSRD